jgi:hypothetical protein
VKSKTGFAVVNPPIDGFTVKAVTTGFAESAVLTIAVPIDSFHKVSVARIVIVRTCVSGAVTLFA